MKEKLHICGKKRKFLPTIVTVKNWKRKKKVMKIYFLNPLFLRLHFYTLGCDVGGKNIFVFVFRNDFSFQAKIGALLR